MLNEDGTLIAGLRIQRQPRSFGLADGIFYGRASTLCSFSEEGTSQPQEKPNLDGSQVSPDLAGDENWVGGFGSGTNGVVDAIAVSGNDLYVGGAFTQAGGITANNVAVWDAIPGTWSALGSSTANGTSGTVNAMAVSGSDFSVSSCSTAGGVDV